MRKWDIIFIDGHAVPVPKFDAKCPFCGTQLLLHDFRVYNQVAHKFLHCDVHLKCPNCGFFLTFGIPISGEEYELLRKSKFHGRILKWELTEIYSDEEKEWIKKKLEQWGYW